MKEIGYHRSLDLLSAAAAQTRCGMHCLAVPLTAPGEGTWDRLRGRARWAHQHFVWRQHLELAARVAALPRKTPILVREFSTLPLALLAARFWPDRNRLFFLVNHNLQWAARSSAERLGLTFLDRMGFRFIFFETLEIDVLKRWRFHLRRHGVLPLPVSDARFDPARNAGDPPRIGLVGQYRQEKGMDPAIFNLLDARDLSCRLRVGVPNLDEFRRFSPAYARRGEYEIADTQAPGAFRKFLEECDVIVLNYEASAYAYRPSGLMADAAGCGVPVVIPNLPVQRVQVRTPVPIGEVRAAGEPLSTAVIRAAAAGRARRYDFAAYARARSQDALTRILDARVAEAGIP